MSNEQVKHHFQAIRRQIAALHREDTVIGEEIEAVLEDLQVTYEQMQMSLATIQSVEEELFQQKQYYQNLFQFSPIAYLVTDANGLILEANQALARLLNISHCYLVGKPLTVFVAGDDRPTFRTHLNRLSQEVGIQFWQMRLCPRNGKPVAVEFHVAIFRNTIGHIENLKIGLYTLNHSRRQLPQSASIPRSLT